MIELHYPSDCGNAPKKKFLIDLNKAFVEGDFSKIEMALDTNVECIMDGNLAIKSKKKFLEKYKSMFKADTTKLQINNIITHGKTAACHGIITTKDGNQYLFADIYEFKSAGSKLISKLTSFITIVKQ